MLAVKVSRVEEVKTPGNYAHFLAKNKHDTDVKVFLTDPGGRGDNWKVKVGTGTGVGESDNAGGSHTSFNDKDTAILKAAEFMKSNPEVEWRSNEYPNLVTSDGERVEKV